MKLLLRLLIANIWLKPLGLVCESAKMLSD